jgi:threonine dehydrogenase-like Zn-dependent dehydrogenase
LYKKIELGNGVVTVNLVAPELLRLIAEGRATISFIISIVIGIKESPDVCARLARQEEIKVVI